MIDPDIGVITNIGDAHRRIFLIIKSKAAEKLKLFMNASLIVYCSDHKIIQQPILRIRILKQKNF